MLCEENTANDPPGVCAHPWGRLSHAGHADTLYAYISAITKICRGRRCKRAAVIVLSLRRDYGGSARRAGARVCVVHFISPPIRKTQDRRRRMIDALRKKTHLVFFLPTQQSPHVRMHASLLILLYTAMQAMIDVVRWRDQPAAVNRTPGRLVACWVLYVALFDLETISEDNFS